jgi:DNA-binding IclR family transcriptional regulator
MAIAATEGLSAWMVSQIASHDVEACMDFGREQPAHPCICGLVFFVRIADSEVSMAHTYEELKHKTIADLREIAKGVENQEVVQGFSQMNKEHLLPALCKALGIDTFGHHHVEGIDKAAIKTKMHELKKKRDAALAAHDGDTLKSVRRQIHRLNRQIRAHVAP